MDKRGLPGYRENNRKEPKLIYIGNLVPDLKAGRYERATEQVEAMERLAKDLAPSLAKPRRVKMAWRNQRPLRNQLQLQREPTR